MLHSDFVLEFGSLLAYCPHVRGKNFDEATRLVYDIKNDKMIGSQLASEMVAEYIEKNLSALFFKDFFQSGVSLVPVPRSSLLLPGALWPAERLCKALAKRHLGVVYPCISRITPIRKSSASKASERPTAKEHYDTLRVSKLIPLPTRIILVDDVVTKGATLIACAARLTEAFPHTPVFAFAGVRTISKSEDFSNLFEPVKGEVKFFSGSGKTHREP